MRWFWQKKPLVIKHVAYYATDDGNLFRLCEGTLTQIKPPIVEVKEIVA